LSCASQNTQDIEIVVFKDRLMFAKLSALVGSSSSLPFEIVEEHGHGWGHWTHSAGKMYADGSRVSVFRISAESETDPKLIAARNGVKRLKMVRGQSS